MQMPENTVLRTQSQAGKESIQSLGIPDVIQEGAVFFGKIINNMLTTVQALIGEVLSQDLL
jgi:hypothetical protein